MKSLLVFPLLLAAAVAVPMLGKEQCAHGPKVWCKNVQTASQCGAVKHCQQNIWNKPTARNVPCDICKDIVSVVDNVLKDNSTETKVLSFLEKICELVPDARLSTQCKEMLDMYYPVILNILKEELDNPGVACCALGLCSSLQQHLGEEKQHDELQTNEIDLSRVASPFLANVPLLLYPQNKPQEETKTSGDVCKDCIQLFTDVQDAVKSNSTFVANFIEHLKEQCDHLGPGLADLCKDKISAYSDLVVQMLVQMQASDICSAIGFCSAVKSFPLQSLTPAKEVPLQPLPAKVIPAVKLVKAIKKDFKGKNPVQCEVCELIVEKVESLLEQNRTRDSIEHAVEKVCYLLPAQYAEQCIALINTYGDAIIDLLVEAASPKIICSTLGLCSSRRNMLNVIMRPKHLEAGSLCEICKKVVKYLDIMLEKNATQTQIEEALERVCNFFPDSMKDECDVYVEQYAPQLLQFLLIMLDPTFVCMKVGCCGTTTQPLLGTEECTFGPSYWCKNMETATNCNAVEHCKRHVWN